VSLYLITEGPNDGRRVDGVSRSHWNYVNRVQAAKLSHEQQVARIVSEGYLCDRGVALSKSGNPRGSELDVVYREGDLK
jgi:hypothetical protein